MNQRGLDCSSKVYLRYLEQGEKGTTMQPWFWVLLLFGYPLADSLLTEWYLRVSVGAHAHFLGQN